MLEVWSLAWLCKGVEALGCVVYWKVIRSLVELHSERMKMNLVEPMFAPSRMLQNGHSDFWLPVLPCGLLTRNESSNLPGSDKLNAVGLFRFLSFKLLSSAEDT